MISKCPWCNRPVKYYIGDSEVSATRMKGTDRLCPECYENLQKDYRRDVSKWQLDGDGPPNTAVQYAIRRLRVRSRTIIMQWKHIRLLNRAPQQASQ